MPILVRGQLRFSIKKLADEYYEKKYEEFKARAKEELDDWRATLRAKLSIEAPKTAIDRHTVRPDALFPHLNTGALRDSVKTIIKESEGAKGVYKSLVFYAQIGPIEGPASEILTNEGFARRKDGSIPSWVGWLDKVLYYGGSYGVRSFNDVVSNLIDNRKRI
jgi:hypothetical protein